MNYRSFIALEVPTPPRECLVQKLRWLRPNPGVNWVKEENLHLTLLFLGDVDSARIPDLAAILKEATESSGPFQLALNGLNIFPNKFPRMIWAGLSDEGDKLSVWHKRLLGEVRRAGFEPDPKPLKLHITLGRIKASLPATLERDILQSEVEKGFYAYSRVTLYRSVLKPEGPSYNILEQYILQ